MKILVLRFSSIGDIVLTTPVVRCLKKQTGAEIHFLVKKNFAPVVESNPHVSRVFTFEKDVDEVLPFLKKENYDHVLDLHRNLRSLRVKLTLGKPATTFDKINFEKWLLVNTRLDLLPEKHIVGRYFQAVEKLGVRYDGAGLDFFIPPGAEVDVRKIFPTLPDGGFVSFVIGAAHATKRLPMEKMIEICRRCAKPIILLGGKAEATDGEKIASASGSHVFNACGKLNLYGSASVVRQSEKVLTHDTGLMHVAAAFGKEIISVWGNTIPRFGMYPFYPDGVNRNTTIEITGLKCRPCSKIGFDCCPKGHFRCMNDISVEQVAGLLN